ncbi:hypothetical protein HHI36_003922 [Cryptolaemus montrouzieri]|uniref:A-kinase anchor protein 7-like phosphoesterase domain-containing protein n=1 Tax=Cryptolaemus montrouzieri TaxID=559131 RepID=A0ABD2NRA1_9CUCU
MNDDPTEVDVLYARVQMKNESDNDNFQNVADQISNVFYKNGYVRRQYDNVKLHVTLLNSLFRKDGSDKRTTFDASYILEKYKNYEFGSGVFKSIDLSIRFSTGKNGYYDSVVSIPVSR